MTIALSTLVQHIDQLLKPELFQDYCPNGLQVEGATQVKRLMTGVTASQALLDRAVAWQADAVLVHHGYFWRNENPCMLGMKRQRLHTLLQHNISLLAYHLPLDAHPVVGNNRQLADKLGFKISGPLQQHKGYVLGQVGRLAKPLTMTELEEHITISLGRRPLMIPANDQPVQTMAWCTGAAQHLIHEAVLCGVDAYLSGEISESTTHVAREENIHYIAAGHHATERYGVQALGAYLAEQFAIEHHFVDSDNPV